MLWRVSRRVQHVESYSADVADVSIAQKCRACVGAEAIAPVVAALAGKQQPRAGQGGEFARARYEIGVDVRFGDGRDAQAFGSRLCDVLVQVAIGIDDDRLAGRGAADEVARLSEGVVVEACEEHQAACWSGASSEE